MVPWVWLVSNFSFTRVLEIGVRQPRFLSICFGRKMSTRSEKGSIFCFCVCACVCFSNQQQSTQCKTDASAKTQHDFPLSWDLIWQKNLFLCFLLAISNLGSIVQPLVFFFFLLLCHLYSAHHFLKSCAQRFRRMGRANSLARMHIQQLFRDW